MAGGQCSIERVLRSSDGASLTDVRGLGMLDLCWPQTNVG